MSRFVKSVSKKAGTAPGTLVHIGEKRSHHTRISLTDYDGEHFKEQTLETIEAAFAVADGPTTTWINIDGLHDIALMEKIGARFQIHPLTLEDVLNTGQRPKLEIFDHYLYLVCKMLLHREGEICSEQVSLVLGSNVLLSFQEEAGDVFAAVRERIRRGRGRIRRAGPDYLAYALVDAVVDHYFLILEKTGDRIEALEEELMDDPGARVLQEIHDLKREMIYMRKQVWPLRELVSSMVKGESDLVQAETGLFFRDVYDHTIQVMDTIESYRDLLSGMIDLYLSTVSNRMNEVMKLLTLIATIFIPITFVAGIYGMNFEFMPELKWRWGYPAVWIAMGAVAAVMLVYFKKKRWI